MIRNILKCTWPLLTAKNDLYYSVSSAEAEKSWRKPRLLRGWEKIDLKILRTRHCNKRKPRRKMNLSGLQLKPKKLETIALESNNNYLHLQYNLLCSKELKYYWVLINKSPYNLQTRKIKEWDIFKGLTTITESPKILFLQFLQKKR